MKILIAYYSQTGNTEKIALALKDVLALDHDTEIHRIEGIRADFLNGFDIIFVGSPCHAGTVAAPVQDFLQALAQNPGYRLAGFVTHASSAYERKDYENCIKYFESLCGLKGIRYCGCFECQGFLSPDLHDFIKSSRKIPDDEWEKMVQAMKGHPDTNDEMNAKNFALDLMKQCQDI